MDNSSTVAMSKETALTLLDRLEASLNASKSVAAAKGLDRYYTRDVQFIQEARSCLKSDDRQKVQWLLNEMRNLSQGFGSYCSDLKKLDSMLDDLFAALEDALTH